MLTMIKIINALSGYNGRSLIRIQSFELPT
jgi:hypothetical protein